MKPTGGLTEEAAAAVVTSVRGLLPDSTNFPRISHSTSPYHSASEYKDRCGIGIDFEVLWRRVLDVKPGVPVKDKPLARVFHRAPTNRRSAHMRLE